MDKKSGGFVPALVGQVYIRLASRAYKNCLACVCLDVLALSDTHVHTHTHTQLFWQDEHTGIKVADIYFAARAALRTWNGSYNTLPLFPNMELP